MTKSISLVYLCYLVFQLFSHKNLYDDHHSDVQQSVQYTPRLAKMLHINRSQNPPPTPHPQSDDSMDSVNAQRDVCSVEKGTMEEDDIEVPRMGIRTAMVLFAVVTVVRR
jgi:Ca2+:H+ antiporter